MKRKPQVLAYQGSRIPWRAPESLGFWIIIGLLVWLEVAIVIALLKIPRIS